jgi:hypothetical protein
MDGESCSYCKIKQSDGEPETIMKTGISTLKRNYMEFLVNVLFKGGNLN